MHSDYHWLLADLETRDVYGGSFHHQPSTPPIKPTSPSSADGGERSISEEWIERTAWIE